MVTGALDHDAAGPATTAWTLLPFEVMFQPDLYDVDDADVAAARERARAILYGRVRDAAGRRADARIAGIAAWSLVHGFAALWINGSLPRDAGDPETLARSAASVLFRGRRR